MLGLFQLFVVIKKFWYFFLENCIKRDVLRWKVNVFFGNLGKEDNKKILLSLFVKNQFIFTSLK